MRICAGGCLAENLPGCRFTMWQYRLIRRIVPRQPRRYTMVELELRAKELQIMLFGLCLGLTATILDAVLFTP
jgi:hypothetical protein